MADETTPLNGQRHVSISMPPIAGVLERRNSRYRRQSSAIHALNAAGQIREHELLLNHDGGGDDAGAGGNHNHNHTGHRRQSVFDVRNPERGPTRMEAMYGAVVDVQEQQKQSPVIQIQNIDSLKDGGQPEGNIVQRIASQIPAILIVAVLNCMIGIPFGASYFPVGWSSSSSVADTGAPSNAEGDDDVSGDFPLGQKEVLGLRMFLFSTAMA